MEHEIDGDSVFLTGALGTFPKMGNPTEIKIKVETIQITELLSSAIIL